MQFMAGAIIGVYLFIWIVIASMRWYLFYRDRVPNPKRQVVVVYFLDLFWPLSVRELINGMYAAVRTYRDLVRGDINRVNIIGVNSEGEDQ